MPMPLYHIFKLIIIVLFGFIMMFDTGMFLLSFDIDYIGIGWKHLARYNWPHSFSCVARSLKRQIS